MLKFNGSIDQSYVKGCPARNSGYRARDAFVIHVSKSKHPVWPEAFYFDKCFCTYIRQDTTVISLRFDNHKSFT